MHREAFTLVDAGIRDGPRTLLVTGDPGAGRTRLLAECGERLALGGAVLAAARPLENDQDVPWSTLRSLLRAGLLRAPGSAAVDPRLYAVLTALDGSVPGAGAAPRDTAEVAAALAALLQALGEEQPVGISVDDAHCSDGPSLGALDAAAAQLRHAPVVLLVSSLHTWEGMPRELVRLRGAVGRTLRGAAVRLEAFTEAETRTLVLASSPWCHTESDRDRLARRVFFETGGSPFLIVTLLGGLGEASGLREEVLEWPPPEGTMETPLPITVPSLARRAVMARAAELDQESARVLQAACISALAIDVELVAALVSRPRGDVEHQLAVLERRRFVTFDGERYVIAAPLVAEVVRAEWLLPGECRVLRNRLIELLAPRGDLESRLTRAQLLALTVSGAAAFDAALDVAQSALEVGRVRAARQAIAAGPDPSRRATSRGARLLSRRGLRCLSKAGASGRLSHLGQKSAKILGTAEERIPADSGATSPRRIAPPP